MGESDIQSGQAWIGVVPERWSVEPLGRWFRERKTTVSDADFAPLSVTMQGIVPQLESVAKTDNNANRKLVLKGDFAINSRSDRKGSAGVSGSDGSVSVITTVLLPRGLNPRFTHHLLRSRPFQEEFYRWGHGIVDDLWSTKWSDMKSIRIPVPPEPEQWAIADYLDRETAQIDAFIAKNEELITLLTERRAAVTSLAMSRGFPEVSVRHMVRLIQTGPFGSQLHAEDYVPGGHPLINPMHMIDGRAVPSPDVSISREKAAELRRHELLTDDLVVARRGELGRSALITSAEVGFLCGTGSMLVRPDSRRVLARYLQLAIGSERSRAALREQSVGSTMENLNAGALSALRVPLPPLDTQREVLCELDAANTRIDAALATARRSIELARERRAALISAAVTGKIDVGVAA